MINDWLQNKTILVSVIVPIYKVEKYLDVCINSIVKQTYTNLEIILVDDGSPDRCPQICDSWMEKDSRIKVIHKANGGLSAARNSGLDISEGDYISFVDSDDYIAPIFIEILLLNALRNNAQISCTGYCEVSENAKILGDYGRADELVMNKYEAIKYLFSSDSFGNYAWNKLYRRDLFDNIRFPNGMMMEDLGTTYLLIEKSEFITYNPQKLYYYLQREDSILHNPNENFYKDKIKLSLQRYNFLKNIMGDFDENIEFIIEVIFQCFPNIIDDKETVNTVCSEMEYFWYKYRYFFTFRRKVKYYILKYCKKLYVWIFKK